jgi:hypothetical protein
MFGTVKHRAILVFVLSALVLAALLGRGVNVEQLAALVRRAQPEWLLVAVSLGFVQHLLLSTRWWLWERRAGEPLCWLAATDATSAATLIGLCWGPLAGDLLKGATRDRIEHSRWRGLIVDRVGNTAAALTVAAVAYSAGWRPVVLLTGLVLSAALVRRFGPTVVWTSLLTLAVFVAIGAQISAAARALDISLSIEALVLGLPASLLASLIPISALGFTGKEASLAWVYGELSATEVLGLGTALAFSGLAGPGLWYFSRVWGTRGATSQSGVAGASPGLSKKPGEGPNPS